MWLADETALIAADRAYIQDFAGWVSTIHRTEAQVIVAAMRQSDDRELRKALSTRLLLCRCNALLSIGLLYVAVRRRLESSLIEARLDGTPADAREVFRSVAQLAERPFWEYLGLPSAEQVEAAAADPALANEYVDSCERRLAGLRRVSALARQDMLLMMLDAGRLSRILVATPRTVSIIKTGKASELRELSNTAFFLTDISDGLLSDGGDLVAVACPTTPAVVEGIVEDIAFLDEEAGETAGLVELVAEAGLLRTAFDRQ